MTYYERNNSKTQFWLSIENALFKFCELLLLKSFHLISFAKLKIQRVGEIFESLYQLLGCAFNRVFHSCIASFPLILIYLFIYFNILFFFSEILTYTFFLFFFIFYFLFSISDSMNHSYHITSFSCESKTYSLAHVRIFTVSHISRNDSLSLI